jgi:FMN phosphatase YigB (HAD superfamily)
MIETKKSKKKEYELCLFSNIDRSVLLEEYNKEEFQNPLFIDFLNSDGIFILKLNMKKIKNILLIKNIFASLNKLSINLNIKLELQVVCPIYRLKENTALKKEFRKASLKHPIDWLDYKFVFNNGFQYSNKIRNMSDKIFGDNSYFKFKVFLRQLINRESIPTETFYDCNLPQEKKGYTLHSIDEDLWQYKKDYAYQKIDKILNKNRTHYLKWKYNDDISIRYFFLFEDRKENEKKYFIKSHSKKEYIPLSEKQAELMINQLKCDEPEEILGIILNGKFKKIILNNGNKEIIEKVV